MTNVGRSWFVSRSRIRSGKLHRMKHVARQRALWMLWTAVLVGSLAAVVVLNRVDARTGTGHGQSDGLARYGFRFDEVAHAGGVDAVHHAPTFDKQLEHIMPQVASMGAAVAVGDFNKDGWADFYVTDSREG